ncbi:PH domain-containing protein [Haloarcula montana]|uniref:PH domain-containing protein n=1 Tax=Haloarcula montana TaxID=3111776 RepID=UPI002D7810D4|nr:PH domain-containing protein [Haloarcula sp. GH36]
MRRLHPTSGVISVAQAMFQGAFLGFFAGSALAGTGSLPLLSVPGLAMGGAALFGAYAGARYLRFRYEITGGTLAVESGVFARQSREIPLGRIQNVDVRQGVLNRVLGLAVVEFETAGGSATEATLESVETTEADRLRRLVQRHDREAEPDRPDAESTEREPTREREPTGTELFAFGPRELLTYAAVSVRPSAPVLTLVGLPLGQDLVFEVLRFNVRFVGAGDSVGLPILRETAVPRLVALAGLTLLQFLVVAVFVSAVLTILEYHGFRLVRDGDDLRYERGLVRRYSGAIPLAKVQTVTIRENVLMRRFGYATLVVETAGYAAGSQGSTQGVAVPMAPRDTVYDLARDIEPFGDLTFERPPPRARRRYAVRFAMAAGVLTAVAYAADRFLLQSGTWWPLLGLLALAVPAAHLRWRHRGFALDEDAVATRSGFWRRTTRVVPYYRIQTVLVGRSPFQRWRHLATVSADTASTASVLGGDARAYDLDEGTATELRETLRSRLYDDLLERRRRRRVGTEGDQGTRIGPEPPDDAVPDDESTDQ